MFIGVVDGTVVVAQYFIRLQYDRRDKGVREKLGFFQCEKDGVVIYPSDNLADAENALQQLNLPYIVEVLDYEVYKPKAQGVKYASRTEAINHLLNDAEPASQVIPNMKKNLADKELKILAMEDRTRLMEQKLEDEKARNDKLEERLLKLEKT